jgi:hypothetical protein
MAAPNVAGVAAVIRSYYPTLTASQVKHILMDSGVAISETVVVGGNPKQSVLRLCLNQENSERIQRLINGDDVEKINRIVRNPMEGQLSFHFI